ncbi:Asp-tRNA(Asn)/Glu-tRNA(Gln) amidotransferase subunit GatC [Candidatus Kaiserbacteria bacterium]|nr:Asp-tRNA(Asn)/Glu-tRNA(Gln) amidotransferase subunit GatC [Candidatus Kaiserbacteria bacterium]
MAIDKKTLEHLAKLARLELESREEEKMIHDLGKVLEHFEELKEVDTEAVAPLTGGTELKNALRNDAESRDAISGEAAKDALPNVEGGFLKVPSVFE